MADRVQSIWVILLVGIVIGALAMWGFIAFLGEMSHSVTPYVVEGYSNGSNYDGTAIGVTKVPPSQWALSGGSGDSYVIAGARWQEFGGPWNLSGTPPSLAQPNTGQKVRLGIVDVKGTQAPGGPLVAWIEVLSQ